MPRPRGVRTRASEFTLIEQFTAAFRPPRSPLGPGDDCAVLPPSTRRTCVTTDATMEGIHFTRQTFAPEDIGHKALAVNLSDLAAMGARPSWFLCALGLPPWVDAAYLRRLSRGMAALAKTSGILLLGGNVTRADALSVTLTVAGEAPARGALLRSGGKPGDVLYVSGALGGARLGYRLLSGLGRSAPLAPRHKAEALLRQRRPVPRLELGVLAARFARAGMDLSDGLAQDLGHLCAASGCGALLEDARLPVAASVRAFFRGEPDFAPDDFALAGGEDYELLVAIPPLRCAAFERACERIRVPVSRVGVLTRERRVLRSSGRPLPRGFDHRLAES